MPLFIVNSTTDSKGARVPVVQPQSWVGNIYQKGGNVFKYLMLTPTDITGLAGVFGPILLEDVQEAIDSDNGTIQGWAVSDIPEWAIHGLGWNE